MDVENIMNIHIISLFPEFFTSFCQHSMTKRAIENGHLSIEVVNPRDFSHNKHQQVDDTPYGGGAGMLMMAPPIFEAVESIPISEEKTRRVIFLGPAGAPLTQDKVKELSTYDELVLVCGHYEGVDYRVEEHLVDETISIGDYVLTGGEIPAMVLVDAVSRMLPGVLGDIESAETDSFYQPLLQGPQYTKPREYRGWHVPDVLLSGHHKHIESWRHREAVIRTYKMRPDLLERIRTREEEKIIQEIEDSHEC